MQRPCTYNFTLKKWSVYISPFYDLIQLTRVLPWYSAGNVFSIFDVLGELYLASERSDRDSLADMAMMSTGCLC